MLRAARGRTRRFQRRNKQRPSANTGPLLISYPLSRSLRACQGMRRDVELYAWTSSFAADPEGMSSINESSAAHYTSSGAISDLNTAQAWAGTIPLQVGRCGPGMIVT